MCMKKLVLALLCSICLPLSISAQDGAISLQDYVELKEQRVYYVDVTASMIGYNGSENIWNSVTKNLKKAIDNIQDESTEIVIKTFTDADSPITAIVSEYATEDGKKAIKDAINKLDPSQNTQCHTDIFLPFNDFYKYEISKTKVNYFFLMTDGHQYSKRAGQLTKVINGWNTETKNGEKHIYGFYVMLCDGAHLSPADSLCMAAQKHLWGVQSASVDINLIRPKKSKFVCDIRQKDSKRYIDIPMSGNISHAGLSISGENEFCRVDTFEIKDNSIRVYFANKKHLAQIPKISTMDNIIISQPRGEYDFLLADKVSVTCDNLTPWAKIGICIGSFVLLLLLIWFLLVKPSKYRTFKTFRKQVLIKHNGRITKQQNIVFTGARMVVFADKMMHQSILNKVFTGKIITFVSPEFTSPITFRPTSNRKNSYISGVGYSASQNPIVRNGVATITNKQLALEITLN